MGLTKGQRLVLQLGWRELSAEDKREILNNAFESLSGKDKAQLRAYAKLLARKLTGHVGIKGFLEIIGCLFLHPDVGEFIEREADDGGILVDSGEKSQKRKAPEDKPPLIWPPPASDKGGGKTGASEKGQAQTEEKDHA